MPRAWKEQAEKLVLPLLWLWLFTPTHAAAQNFWQQTNGPSSMASPIPALAVKTGNNHLFAGTSVVNGAFRSAVSTFQIAVQDSLALVDLYNSTNGANWTNKGNWLSTAPLSTWFGVTVTGNRVTQLDFPGNNLAGPLPATIGDLTNLTELDLTSNRLSGPLPKEIGNLTNLAFLYLLNNRLNGTIPTEIGKLANLLRLDLRANQFTGFIPAEMGNLINLQAVFLSNNLLSGPIAMSLGNLTNLTTLQLENNVFTGAIPAAIGNLVNLRFLLLSGNQLTGAVPNNFINLSSLESLGLHHNLLTDLPDLSMLPLLSSLEIQNNKFTFEDIEPNLAVPNFIYSPQDSVGAAQDTTLSIGASFTLSVAVGGANNQYQWFKDGVAIFNAMTSFYMLTRIASGDSGTYHCVITNTEAAALTLISRPVRVKLKPALSVSQTPPMDNNAVNITVTLNVNFQPTTSQLFYRRAGELDFRATALSQAGKQFSGAIPASFVTFRGVEFYVSLSDTQNVFTYPETNPQLIPQVLPVRFGQLGYAPALQPETYKMISAPVELNASALDSVLLGNYGPYDILPRQWRLFRWENGSYSEYSNIAARLKPGNAFWLITREGKGFTVGAGQSVNSAEPVSVTLQPGWNQIANPFAFPVDWNYVDAGDSIQFPIFYDGTQYLFERTVLEPWEGYFIFNQKSAPVSLFIPPIAPSSAAAKIGARLHFSDQEVVLKIAALIPGAKLMDSENYIGLREHAAAGLDALDFYDPPPIGEHVRLIIFQEGHEFAGNFKPLNEQGQQWELQISSSRREQEAQIQLHEISPLPEGFQIYVLDKDLNEPIPMSNNSFAVKISKKFPLRRLKILVGTQAFAEQNSDHISLVPIAFVLYQNYPNPFNPEAAIQYQISKPGPVKLEIFNLMGQKIRTLVDEKKNPGLYSVKWQGLNDAGRAVPSGVYFYRLTAGEFTATRKLVISR